MAVDKDSIIGRSSEEIARGIIERFPITASLPDQRVTSGHSYWVGVPEHNNNAGFKLSLNINSPVNEMGRYDARIHVESKEALAGFVGAALFKFEDRRGNVVYAEMSSSYGVNGTVIPGAPSDRTENFVGSVPLQVLAGTSRVIIEAYRAEDDALGRLKSTVADFKEGSRVLSDAIVEIGADIAKIAAVVKGAG